MVREHIHFVTGKLAAAALHEVAAEVAAERAFTYSIEVLPITVAALMSPAWVARHIHVPLGTQRLLIPGYCHGDLTPIEKAAGNVPVERGPRDLRQLPEYFGRTAKREADYGAYDIEIIAEINHAPRISLTQVLGEAKSLREAGANVIDVGCDPGDAWSGVADCVRALRGEGHRVSIDSLNPVEIEAAVNAGAELVLSVNSGNRLAARDWNCEVVAIPDVPHDPNWLGNLEETLAVLEAGGVKFRIDPVLEPIGCGFAASLARYSKAREKFPHAAMLMGIGNLTELTDADSAGINVLLLGFCQELGIHSVLTTQVINWARSSVQECDLARRLVHYAVRRGIPPKHMEPLLVMLRDSKLYPQGPEQLARLASTITDHNYRLFAENEQLHLITAGLHLTEDDPFVLFERLLATQPRHMDPCHAFYLGYELAKAITALTLGKQYRQDEALNWGLLTRPEVSHRQRRSPLPGDAS